MLARFGLREALPKEYQDMQQDSPLKGSRICNLINHIQLVMDGQHIEIRKTLNKYADLIEQQRRILFTKREALLGELLRPTILMTRVPAIYEQLCRRFGEKRVEEAERFITLVQIDNGWADYLAYVSSVKEGIHLESLSHKNPLHEYHRLIINAFATLEERIETAVVELFLTTDFCSLKIDFHLEALRVPSATWTYMINDSFFQNRINLL